MKKSYRILCLALAIAFALTMLVSIIVSVASAEGLDSRGETVYVETDASGNVLSMISSVYITNPSAAETVTDSTTLTNIKNVLGSEAPETNGNEVTFKANGEDVCYQGEASGELPFSLKLTYYLNGNETDPQQMAGKSGRARVEIECKNELKKTVELDGNEEELYVPFSVIGMLTLDEGCTDVESDAKITTQAGVTTVLTVMLPGLAQSLGMESTDKLKESFYIEFDTECFEFGQCTFIAMTGIVSESDLSGIDDISELMNALDQINDANSQLYSGAKKLRNGAKTLNEGIEEYTAGLTSAADGVNQLAEGSEQLDSGMSEISLGMDGFSSAIDEIVAKVDAAKDKIDELQDPSAEVDERIIAMMEAEINAALAGKEEEIKEAVRKNVYDALKNTSLTDEEKAEIADAAAAAVNLDDISIKIDANTANAIRMAVIELDEVKSALSKLDEIVGKVDDMAAGADQLASGMHQVSNAMGKLSRGLEELDDGLSLLDENGAQLADGTRQLYKGLDSLTDGLKQVSTDGIGKIVEETAEIQLSLSRKDALLELSQGYTAFSSAAENVVGSVQFVITTEAVVEPLPIEIPSPTPQQSETGDDVVEATVVEKKTTIIDWFANIMATIKGWFN